MKMISERGMHAREKYLNMASALAIITIAYNMAEGAFSLSFGLEDETITLFGFGVDSFVEVISGVGIWHMIRRLRQNGNESHDRFERRALRITGTAFYILTAGLAVTSAVTLYHGGVPETTFWGIVVAIVSIITMWFLIRYKVDVGRKLKSNAILADANCTRTCLYLSFVLLVSSAGFELTGIGGLDAVGALGIAWLSFREGREAFKKASGNICSCGESCAG